VRVLLIDNRDSFTWNIAMALSELGAEVDVRRADELSWRDAAARAPERSAIGPGPGTPERATTSLAVIEHVAGPGGIPTLGICLGHQALAVAFGGRSRRARTLAHGRAVAVEHEGTGLFRGLPSPAFFTVYNSLVVDEATLPECLAVTARAEDGEIMGLRHRELDLSGVQFHPESILSAQGLLLLRNFLS
jgi:anthranilate synthase component 2